MEDAKGMDLDSWVLVVNLGFMEEILGILQMT